MEYEFKRTVLEVMLANGRKTGNHFKSKGLAIDFPSSFMLIASMNPCPCSFYNHPEKCTCLCAGHCSKYLNKISGPLLDRIDLHVEVTPVAFNELSNAQRGESSAQIREVIAETFKRNAIKKY